MSTVWSGRSGLVAQILIVVRVIGDLRSKKLSSDAGAPTTGACHFQARVCVVSGKTLGVRNPGFEKQKNDSSLRSSQTVPRPSSSEVKRDPVHSTRQREMKKLSTASLFIALGQALREDGRPAVANTPSKGVLLVVTAGRQ